MPHDSGLALVERARPSLLSHIRGPALLVAVLGACLPPAVAQTDHLADPDAVVASTVPLAEAAPNEVAAGQQLFQAHCVACHGPEGVGGKGPTLAQPTLPRGSTDEALLRIITNGISGTEMPRTRLDETQIRQVAAYVRALGRRPIEPVPGDPLRGARLYREVGGCAQCHSVNGQGGAIGPDLSEIGRQRSAAHLRRALVEPGAEVPRSFSAFRGDSGLPANFLFVRVVTQSGDSVSGVRVNEDSFSVQLRDLTGRVHSFLKSDLKELHKDRGFSPMPSYAALSSSELDDLVAYLVSLQGKK